MSKSLVIVESAAKAKTINKYLGKDYEVEASFGHIMDLPKNDIGVELKRRTFEPTLIVSPGKEKVVDKLKKLAAKNKIKVTTDEVIATVGGSQALYAAAVLGVADHLVAGPAAVETLADSTGAHAPALERLLRLLG